jgi:outer membrane protein assembly factor BamE (lipoprotein component of BamABCDE complex)
VAGFQNLKVGQSRQEVRDALGPPDEASPRYGKDRHATFRGWGYTYEIKTRTGGPNTNDVCVQVFFDPDDTLLWAVPSHIAGLSDVGHPGRP